MVEVNFKYDIPPLSQAVRERLNATGDELRVRGQNRVPLRIRIYDSSGREIVAKDDTFDPNGSKQGSFFPRTWKLPEGGRVRYSFEVETRRGGSLVLEGEQVVNTLYSHATQFRQAAETHINPDAASWTLRAK
jgi:hypothetical protein